MTAAGVRYSKGAIGFHWLIALALAGQLALGFAMPRDASGFALYQLHKSVGITILALSLARLAWRFTHARPARLEGGWEGSLASAVHAGFYIFMIAMPLTGWAIVSTDALEIPTLLFGTVPWPHLPLPGGWNGAATEAHEWLAYGGIALFGLHVAGALRHHFLLRDGLLARMSPGGAGFALAMLAAVLLLGSAVFFALGGSAEHDHADHQHGEGEEQAGSGASPDADGAAPSAETADEHYADGHSHDEKAGEGEAAEEPAVEASAEPQDMAGPPPSWAIQPGGNLRFSVQNAGAALNGGFSRWSGEIAMDPDDPADARIAIRVDLASASLGDATQDEMLASPAFFGTAANPTATWRSTSVRRLGGNRYAAEGTLSLKGASRPQRIEFTLGGSGARRSVSGHAMIDRNLFSVGTGPNAADLGGTVHVSFAFDATS